MNKKFKDFLLKIKNPPNWMIAVIYFVTFLAVVGAVLILTVDYVGTAWEIVAYALFGVSALCLAYAVYVTVLIAPKIKNAIVKKLESNNFTKNLLKNYGFKTVVFSIGAFIVGAAFAIINGVTGILQRSIWYGALAAYYLLITLVRGGVLIYHQKRRSAKKTQAEELFAQIKTYRNCGILMLILNLALSAAIAQMIFNNESFSYSGLMIYASAAYAFYKIITSVINFIKAKKQSDLTVEAIRNINLVDAMVSILALQTALLTTFENGEVNVSLFNTFTGIIVSVGALSIAVFMIVKSYKRKKQLLTEKNNGKSI